MYLRQHLGIQICLHWSVYAEHTEKQTRNSRWMFTVNSEISTQMWAWALAALGVPLVKLKHTWTDATLPHFIIYFISSICKTLWDRDNEFPFYRTLQATEMEITVHSELLRGSQFWNPNILPTSQLSLDPTQQYRCGIYLKKKFTLGSSGACL